MPGNDQAARPLTFASPVVAPAADMESGGGGGGIKTSTQTPPAPPSRGCCGSRRRCLIWCGGCCGATIVILGLLALILALTVFKVKDPELNLNAMYLDNINVGLRDPFTGSPTSLLSVNTTITADMSVKNPNVASFRFGNSSTEIAYDGDVIGVAHVPAGNAKAHRTARMNVTVEVLADKLSQHPNMTTDVLGGDLRLSSFTEIGGRVNVLGIFKKHLDLQLRCNLTIAVFVTNPQNTEVKRKDCRTKVL